MISVVGISHHCAPLSVREQFTVPEDALPAALLKFRARFGAAVLISTCNRTELYVSVGSGQRAVDSEGQSTPPVPSATELGQAFAALSGAEPPPEALYVHRGPAAARHLCRVAAGLDSLIVGEDQILGQVRAAFIAAVEAGTADRLLSRLFHRAIRVGRRVRTETALGSHARSVSAAAVEAVTARIPDLRESTVLLIGAGAAGELAARALATQGVGTLLIANRTRERAASLAAATGGTAISLHEVPAALAGADVVIAASGAPDYTITVPILEEARSGVREQEECAPPPLRTGAISRAPTDRPLPPLLLMDIAVPRDVEPAAATLAGITLLDIDALGLATAEEGAAASIRTAEAIVESEVAALVGWWETLRVVPTISALRRRAEAIRRAELTRTFSRLPHLSATERGRIEALTAAIVGKLLHEPISRLKQPGGGEQYAALVHDLFALPVDLADEPAP